MCLARRHAQCTQIALVPTLGRHPLRKTRTTTRTTSQPDHPDPLALTTHLRSTHPLETRTQTCRRHRTLPLVHLGHHSRPARSTGRRHPVRFTASRPRTGLALEMAQATRNCPQPKRTQDPLAADRISIPAPLTIRPRYQTRASRMEQSTRSTRIRCHTPGRSTTGHR